MQVTQKDVSILYEIQKHFGGRVYNRAGLSGCSKLDWNGQDTLCLAEDMLPYSHCKRDQLSALLAAAQVPPKERESLHLLMTAMKSQSYAA